MSSVQSKGVQASVLDIYADSYSGVYTEIFQGNVVKNFHQGRASGKIKTTFSGYLYGFIRHKVFETAQKTKLVSWRRLSEKELLDRMVDSKKKDTKQRHIGLAKSRYAERVRGYLLGKYAEPLGNVVDYFFEVFCAKRYPEIRVGLNQPGEALVHLLNAFGDSDYETAKNYSAAVATLHEPMQICLTENEDIDYSEDELLSRLSHRDDEISEPVDAEACRLQRVALWDQMIQGAELDVAMVRGHARQSVEASSDQQERQGAVLCLTCAQMLAEGTTATKRNLRIFLVHHFSKCGLEKPLQNTPEPEKLTLADIEGTQLSWQQASDIFVDKVDYSAHARIKSAVGETFAQTWEQVMGSSFT